MSASTAARTRHSADCLACGHLALSTLPAAIAAALGTEP